MQRAKLCSCTSCSSRSSMRCLAAITRLQPHPHLHHPRNSKSKDKPLHKDGWYLRGRLCGRPLSYQTEIAMSPYGTSRRFAASQQRGRFRSEADWPKERKGDTPWAPDSRDVYVRRAPSTRDRMRGWGNTGPPKASWPAGVSLPLAWTNFNCRSSPVIGGFPPRLISRSCRSPWSVSRSFIGRSHHQ
jgi:hypothetical protein